jgi:hypothetical protein
VTSGVFTVELDYNSNRIRSRRGAFLEIAVRPANSGGAYTILSPRQPVTPRPTRSAAAKRDRKFGDELSATRRHSGGALHSIRRRRQRRIGGNLFINGTLTANLPAGDSSYIQNRLTPQTGTTNFNISGNGTVGGNFERDKHQRQYHHRTITDSSVYRLGGEMFCGISVRATSFVGVSAGGVVRTTPSSATTPVERIPRPD